MPELTVRRRLIFSSPINREGWPYDMIRTLQVAKALGVQLFEIDLPGTVQQKALPREVLVTFASLFGRSVPSEDEEWKDAAERPATTEVPVVSVWAMTVEDEA